MNERAKYELTMSVAQSLLNKGEKELLASTGLALINVCNISDIIQERVMCHVSGLEGQSSKSKQLLPLVIAVGNRIMKLRSKGIHVGYGQGTLPGKKSIATMFETNPVDNV